MRTLLACLALATAAPTFADTPTCDSLDRREDRDSHLDVDVKRGTLKIRIEGAERIKIDARDRVFVDGRELAVPESARPTVAAYRDGFSRLESEALAVGVAGAKIGIDAMTGLLSVLFTDETIEDYEQRIEERGEAIEDRADALCGVVVELERLERELVREVRGFPPVLTRAERREI